MKRTIWLASYPKSGNTWFRMLIANLTATADGRPVDINDLPERGGIASARGPFDTLTLLDSGLLTHEEIDDLRPRVHAALASGMADDDDDEAGGDASVRFVKAHDAYTVTRTGEPLLAGARGADGAIVIVRDPRDVAPSLANHRRTTVDDAITFMNDASAGFCVRRSAQQIQLRQTLLGWSAHVASWLDQSDIRVHLVRYEDMLANTLEALRRALAFSGRAATDEEMRRAVAFSDFTELRRQEQDTGFGEATALRSTGPFFRRGEAGVWRDELTAQQVERIEAAHAPMMQRLDYQLSAVPSLGCADDSRAQVR